MPSKQSTQKQRTKRTTSKRKSAKTQTKTPAQAGERGKEHLTYPEIDRIAQRLAVLLEHESEGVGLLFLLLDHFNRIANDPMAIDCAVIGAKQHLFAGCDAAYKAQSTFERQAWANRASLLLFPNEKREKGTVNHASD